MSFVDNPQYSIPSYSSAEEWGFARSREGGHAGQLGNEASCAGERGRATSEMVVEGLGGSRRPWPSHGVGDVLLNDRFTPARYLSVNCSPNRCRAFRRRRHGGPITTELERPTSPRSGHLGAATACARSGPGLYREPWHTAHAGAPPPLGVASAPRPGPERSTC